MTLIRKKNIPGTPSSLSDANIPSYMTWDWVIQGLDAHILLPYRLQLRANDDSIEDMLRGLKLITAAKTALIFPMKKESSKPKKPSSTKFGSVKFCIRKLTADIEEEPKQGWLDEHYHLMKNEATELAAGSGACVEGFQAGFKPSTARASLLSISARVKKSLTRIDGTLAVHLRNYTFPLFAATSGKCEDWIVLAQQVKPLLGMDFVAYARTWTWRGLFSRVKKHVEVCHGSAGHESALR
ncbi:hypothetical protein POTOM_021452 [Populus tomentosa]|uniref:Uncharacterized protein n=1 Tax=Populus tomentosa TaxID=118781 RepID=A0A8X7ZNF3_POPTO|nr:hypothetical protein POTOM_021452 [Populus tomentosa]